MSHFPLFPQDGGTSSETNAFGKEEKPHFKRPEFIIIDDRKSEYDYYTSHTNQSTNKSFKTQENLISKGSIPLRFLCFLGTFFCAIFAIGILLWSMILTVVAILLFFQNLALNQSVKSFWKLFANTTVISLGFMIGILSPTLGIGFIVLYFALTGEVISNEFLRKIVQRSSHRL